MAYKFVSEHVDDGSVEIDGEVFCSPRARMKGNYWFQVFYDEEGVNKVLGMYPSPNAKWSVWLKDLRERCSLGHTES